VPLCPNEEMLTGHAAEDKESGSEFQSVGLQCSIRFTMLVAGFELSFLAQNLGAIKPPSPTRNLAGSDSFWGEELRHDQQTTARLAGTLPKSSDGT
jgi:hypothetical protein